jgi:hypothetical protein
MDGVGTTNISNDDKMVIYLKSMNIGASSILSIEEHPIFAVPSINIHACEIPERLATMLHLNTLDQSSHPDFLDSLSRNYHHPLFLLNWFSICGVSICYLLTPAIYESIRDRLCSSLRH